MILKVNLAILHCFDEDSRLSWDQQNGKTKRILLKIDSISLVRRDDH
jgi:hypothetical protein